MRSISSSRSRSLVPIVFSVVVIAVLALTISQIVRADTTMTAAAYAQTLRQ